MNMNGFDLSTAQGIYLGSNQVDSVYYGNVKIWPNQTHDYSLDYLTFEPLESTTFTFTKNDLQYSLDDGSTWTTLTVGTATPTINTGNKILWKQTGLTPSNGIGTFSATGNFNIYGNIMSLYYGDNFVGQTNLTGKSWAFDNLFNQNNKLVDASNLILPAITLSGACYSMMFYSCTSLTKAPELPATTLAGSCYYAMFDGCTSLTTAPELPATTLASQCYKCMLRNCRSLTEAPELPATTLADECYDSMFSGCTSLTTTPELPATTLANWCYFGMFDRCTSLTTAPELPATTLAASCYNAMFQGCTSLTTAPELPATTLVDMCYPAMFKGCTSLNYIKCLATDISAYRCTEDWVNGVAATGIFVKPTSMTSWTTGINSIPTNWTIQNV